MSKMEVIVFQNLMTEIHRITFGIFYWLEISRSSSHSRGVDYKRILNTGGGESWDPGYKLPVTGGLGRS